jgi:hypothetical protein
VLKQKQTCFTQVPPLVVEQATTERQKFVRLFHPAPHAQLLRTAQPVPLTHVIHRAPMLCANIAVKRDRGATGWRISTKCALIPWMTSILCNRVSILRMICNHVAVSRMIPYLSIIHTRNAMIQAQFQQLNFS